MGKKQLKKLTGEYREAVLTDRQDIEEIASRLRVEAGNQWPEIEAEIAAEKAKLLSEKKESKEPASVVPGAREDDSLPLEELPSGLTPAIPSVTPVLLTIPSSMSFRHSNDITRLPVGNRWEVYVDESYLGRDKPGERSGDFYDRDGNGLIAGVIVGAANPLPPIEQLHCAKDKSLGPKTPDELRKEDEALDAILNHPACGVLALPVGAQEQPLGYRDLLISWTCVMLTLLPLPEGTGEIVVRCHVEPRSELSVPRDFEVYAESCMRQLRESFPDLAKRIRLECDGLPKVKTPEEKTFNSYPDIVAHTCQHCGRVAQARFKRTNWDGVCYLNAKPREMEKLLHLLFRGERLDGATWSVLLRCEKAGFVRALVAHVGERTQNNLSEWQAYLDETDRHLMSGAIDMKLLRLQVAWLEKFFPKEVLPKRTELIWLTARLALANHEGHVTRAMASARAEFDAACSALYEEDIGLVCRAVLHLAVAYTNAYEFEMALAILQPLLEKEIAFVGRESYGQLLSSAGQHYAFMGDTESAIEKFKAALDCFDKLSDDGARGLNISITSAYLATAVMDGRPEEAVRALAYYLLGDAQAPGERVAEEATRLAQVPADSFADKFKHHIVLRYLVSADREDPIRKAYRACGNEGKWSKPGEAHPWELIEFYRAQLLLKGSQKRMEHLEQAYQIAVNEGGDTVLVIAAVIAGAALCDGVRTDVWKDRLDQTCRKIAHLPALWDYGRFQALADQTPDGLEPLELAKKVLPFNFR